MSDNTYVNPSLNSTEDRNFSTVEVVFAWLSYLLGYLFCRAFPAFVKPLGGFMFIVALVITTFVILKLRGVKFGARSLMAGISSVVVSAAVIITGSGFISFLAYSYAIVSYCYFVYSASGNCLEEGCSDYILVDFLKAVFVLPFCSIFDIFYAMSHGRAKSGAKLLFKIICGIAAAVIPTSIIILLLSFDKSFTSLLANIFSFEPIDVVSQIASLLFAVPIGMYLFGLMRSSLNNKKRDFITADRCAERLGKAKVVPAATAIAAVVPIIFIYVVYFISQWQYYVSGFTGVLPDNFSYAEYAREGFFQLCIVSVINLIIIIVITLFMKGRANIALNILTVTFCLSTLILISTAIAKLVMYIDYYGLTQKRIYAMWLMIVIAFIYVFLAIGRFAPRFKSVFASVAVGVVLFAALSLCNVNSVVAEYNVNRYIDGTLPTVDIEAMDDLGYSAVPALVRLAEWNENTGKVWTGFTYDMKQLLRENAEEIQSAEKGAFEFNLPFYRAERALREYGLIK